MINNCCSWSFCRKEVAIPFLVIRFVQLQQSLVMKSCFLHSCKHKAAVSPSQPCLLILIRGVTAYTWSNHSRALPARHEALLLSKRRCVKSHKREIRAGQLIAVKATTIVRQLLFFVCFFGVSTLCVCEEE